MNPLPVGTDIRTLLHKVIIITIIITTIMTIIIITITITINIIIIIVVQCDIPDNPINGKALYTATAYKSVVSYECK